MARIVKASKVRAKPKRAKVSARSSNRPKSVSMHMVKKARAAKKRPATGIELTVKGWLEEAGIEFKAEYPIGLTHVDFFLPANNTVVEVNGCYWHAHECQKKGDRFSSKQTRKRTKDGKRYAFLKNCGKRLLILWECDIHQDPDKVRSRLIR